MAFRHGCPNTGKSGTSRCRQDQPGKGPKKCPGCGAAIEVEEGTYHVLPWRGDGRYSTEDAVYWYQRESAAQVSCDRMNEAQAAIAYRKGTEPLHPRGYVVRFIRDRLLPLS